MLRIHLAQIFYNPAYYDAPLDYLEEPSFVTGSEISLGRLRSLNSIEDFLSQSKNAYLEHLSVKLINIIRWSAQRNGHIIVFPEYSIPVQLLPLLQELATSNSLIIVSGSHRVPSGADARLIYQRLGMHPSSPVVGSACTPILLPDGTAYASTKLRKSKWESNLVIPNTDPLVCDLSCNSMRARMAVVHCIEALHADILGKLWSDNSAPPDIVICPALSPSNEPFQSAGSLAALKETLFAYVNSASFGGTCFNIPKSWLPFLHGPRQPISILPKNHEAILEINVDPSTLFSKRDSINNSLLCTNPIIIPIVNTYNTGWIEGFIQLRSDITELLTDGLIDEAIEWISAYLTDESPLLPDLVMYNLKYIRHALLPLYDGNIQSINTAMELVTLSDSLISTKMFWAERVERALDILVQNLKDSAFYDSNIFFDCLKNLKDHQQQLPHVVLSDQGSAQAVIGSKIDSTTFVGEENLVEAFQNRGSDLDLVRNFFTNNGNRVILITGSMGIGKSDFLNVIFRKTFGDWQPIKVHIPDGAKVPRIVTDIGYKLGIHIDVDSLASSSHNVFRQRVRKIFTQFYSLPKRALILDDIQQMLRGANARDHALFNIFLQEASSPKEFAGGRIFIVSSLYLPDNWIHTEGVFHLHLRDLQDIYIRRVIEYHMRRANLLKDEAIPETPQSLLNIVRGNPLAARLVVDAMHNINMNKLSDDLILEEVIGHVAKNLLDRVCLSEDEQCILQKLAFFRLPIRNDVLRQIDEFRSQEDKMLSLAKRCILGFDGTSFEMHEAVRRFYYGKVNDQSIKNLYNGLAVKYYRMIYNAQYPQQIKDPTIMAELAHHLALCGEITEANDLRLMVMNEIKPTARKIYREYRNYERALSLYQLMADLCPDDAEIWAYIGRCYARLGQWGDSDRSFEQAIKVSLGASRPSWWIYRDWGQIRSRFQFYVEAKVHFDKAAALNPYDASIKGSMAFMLWKQGRIEEACELFENALSLNQNHRYTLTFYPKLLITLGNIMYARILFRRLDTLESEEIYRVPAEFEAEFEIEEEDL